MGVLIILVPIHVLLVNDIGLEVKEPSEFVKELLEYKVSINNSLAVLGEVVEHVQVLVHAQEVISVILPFEMEVFPKVLLDLITYFLASIELA